MEKDFAEKVISKLKPYFDIYSEVWSRCGKWRIDYILREKQHGVYFGIEFKDMDSKRGEDLGKHILQSMKYSIAEFNTKDGYKTIPIFLCPPISYKFLVMAQFILLHEGREYFADRHDKNHEHHTVNGMLGALNLGEIRTSVQRDKQILYFSFSNKPIWSSEIQWNTESIKGLHVKNYEQLMDKINSFSI